MAQWTDVADWIGPTPNRNPGEMGEVLGLCVHVDEGTEAGSETWERNPQAQVSSTFMGPKTGRPRQMVDTADMAWAQAAGNKNYFSIEFEGNSGDSLTQDQIEGAAQILAKMHRELGVPIQLANFPGERGLIYHAAGGAAWGGHPDCPGAPIIADRVWIIQRAAQLVGAPAPASHPYPGYMLTEGIRGPSVQLMQHALIAAGYSCGPAGADGIFGPDTRTALGRFQLDHPACQSTRSNGSADCICGPKTWSVLRP